MCCACGGGSAYAETHEEPVCYNTARGTTDASGDGCDWYANFPDACGMHDLGEFNAREMCCACGGGSPDSEEVCHDTSENAVDSASDGCTWYVNNPSSCGNHDDNDFNAKDMCCACGGGSIPAKNDTVCTDSNNSTTDSVGDSCSWYIGHESACGSYDTDNFTASTMCCACGGGVTQAEVDAVMDDFAHGMADLLDVNGDDGVPISEELDRLDGGIIE